MHLAECWAPGSRRSRVVAASGRYVKRRLCSKSASTFSRRGATWAGVVPRSGGRTAAIGPREAMPLALPAPGLGHASGAGTPGSKRGPLHYEWEYRPGRLTSVHDRNEWNTKVLESLEFEAYVRDIRLAGETKLVDAQWNGSLGRMRRSRNGQRHGPAPLVHAVVLAD